MKQYSRLRPTWILAKFDRTFNLKISRCDLEFDPKKVLEILNETEKDKAIQNSLFLKFS